MLKNLFYERMIYEKEENKDLGLIRFADGLLDYLSIQDEKYKDKYRRF